MRLLIHPSARAKRIHTRFGASSTFGAANARTSITAAATANAAAVSVRPRHARHSATTTNRPPNARPNDRPPAPGLTILGMRRTRRHGAAHRCHDRVDLIVGYFGVERQRQHLVRGALRFGKRVRLVTQIGPRGLTVNRNRIMHAAGDAVGAERLLQRIALAR